MTSHFQDIRDLHSEGKLHKRLVMQIRILSAISLIMLGVVAYQIFAHGLSFWIALLIGGISFLLGVFVFSKMNKMVWNEEEEVIKAGRMEIVGFVIIALYILFEVSLRKVLSVEYAGTFAATAYLLAGIGSSLLGRSLGTLIAVQKLSKTL